MNRISKKMNNWQKTLRQKYGIRCLTQDELAIFINSNNILWTTRCSATKSCKKGTPLEMYDSYLNRHFYRFVLQKGLPYAVLSDKYGLHFSGEKLDYYDIHPTRLSTKEKILLGEKIRRKAQSCGYDRIVFYNNSPLMSKPYFEMLSNSRLIVYYLTCLRDCNKMNL